MNYHTDNECFFDKVAPFYDFVELFLAGIRREIAGMIPDNQTILDVACGTGSQSILLAQDGHEVTGVDLSGAMLSKAKKKAEDLDIDFLKTDASKMSFEDNSFDVSIILFSLHHMPPDVGMKTLMEMKRVTKEQIIVVDFNTELNWLQRLLLQFPRLIEQEYYWYFIQTGMDRYLEEASLKVVSANHKLGGLVEILECAEQ